MARIIYGACGTAWRAPEWIVRNVAGELLLVLRRNARAAHAARELEAALSDGIAVIDLTEFLRDPSTRQAWLAALDASLSALVQEGAEGWNEPAAFVPAIASIRGFVDAEHARSPATVLAATSDREDAVLASLPSIFEGDFVP